MAFEIIQGNPVRFIGTDGPDSINIRQTTTFELRGEGDNDVVSYRTAVTNSSISLGDGADIFTGNIDGGGTLTQTRVNGNAGNDTIGNPQFGLSVTNSNPTVVATATGQGAGIFGGQGDDTMYITFAQSSRINGNRDNDSIFLGVPGGAPTNISDTGVFGGQGNDQINATGNNASYFNTTLGGSLGDDTITVANANIVQNVSIFGDNTPGDTVNAGGGDDTIVINGAAPQGSQIPTTFTGVTIEGGLGDDTFQLRDIAANVRGVNATITVNGGAGNDLFDARTIGNTVNTANLVLNGDDGADTIWGGSGNDTINGGNGDDVIVGGAGADTLSGGTGNNRFVQRDGSTGTVTFQNLNNDGDTVLLGITVQSLYNNGDTFTIDGGADVITDWNVGAVNVLDTGLIGNATNGTGNNLTRQGPTATGVGNLWFRGDYNATTGVFSINSNSGSDIGVVTTTASVIPDFAPTYDSNFTVLQGAAGTVLDNSDFIVVNPVGPGAVGPFGSSPGV